MPVGSRDESLLDMPGDNTWLLATVLNPDTLNPPDDDMPVGSRDESLLDTPGDTLRDIPTDLELLPPLVPLLAVKYMFPLEFLAFWALLPPEVREAARDRLTPLTGRLRGFWRRRLGPALSRRLGPELSRRLGPALLAGAALNALMFAPKLLPNVLLAGVLGFFFLPAR
jgi:hypothetical protein